MTIPTLIFVSGPPGSGKTTLAHEIGRSVPCPVISRDEIKEGLVHADGGRPPVWGGPVSQATHETFFAVLRALLAGGVTIVAEAALQNDYWKPDLEQLLELAELRIVHCSIDEALVHERVAHRVRDADATRASHPDRQIFEALKSGTMTFDQFEPITTMGPCLRVDTTDGYEPPIEAVIAFINQD